MLISYCAAVHCSLAFDMQKKEVHKFFPRLRYTYSLYFGKSQFKTKVANSTWKLSSFFVLFQLQLLAFLMQLIAFGQEQVAARAAQGKCSCN